MHMFTPPFIPVILNVLDNLSSLHLFKIMAANDALLQAASASQR